jgi:hypothetical protein
MFPIELNLAVQSALGRLSDDQREAVLLKVYQGFKFEEMAEILSCPVSTVKSRLYTALDLLKQTLAPVNGRDGMNCSSVDLKAYFLGESARTEKSSVEDHIRACESCREELERLKLTDAALRRSSKKKPRSGSPSFPTKYSSRAGMRTIWRSGPAMGFASAACWRGRSWCMGLRGPRR